MAELFDHAGFIARLTQEFPAIAEGIDDCSRGLLHCEMGSLSHATQAAIDAGDRDSVRRHFQFADKILSQATPEVQNAIYVSYLEHLRFEGRKAGATKARELLTPRLRAALREVEAFWEAYWKESRK